MKTIRPQPVMFFAACLVVTLMVIVFAVKKSPFQNVQTNTVVPSMQTATDTSAADAAVIKSFLNRANLENSQFDVYSGLSFDEKHQLEASVIALYRAGKLDASVDATSSSTGDTIIRVGYDLGDRYKKGIPSIQGDFPCGLYGEPFCVYLVESKQGNVKVLSLVGDGERAERFINEGALLHARNRDARFGFESYAMIDSRFGERREIIRNDMEDHGCSPIKNTLTGNGLTIVIASDPTDPFSCDVFGPMRFSTSDGKRIRSPLPAGTIFDFVTLDPLATLRSKQKLFFSVNTDTKLEYDGSVAPPKLRRVH